MEIRRANPEDEKGVKYLIKGDEKVLAKRFGAYDIDQLIENSVIAITAINEEGETVGFGAFTNFPSTSGEHKELRKGAWGSWFRNKFGDATGLGPGNTIWLSFFAATALYEQEAADSILSAVYNTFNHVEAILYAIIPGVTPFGPIQERDMFEEMTPEKEVEGEPRMFVSFSTNYRPQLKVRTARVEDHDDLTPIFNEQSELLTETYGEFYLTRIIEAQNKSNQVLVAEVQGKPVGLMSVTSDLDTKILADSFDLAPYNYLAKPIESAEVDVASSNSFDLGYLEDLSALETEKALSKGALFQSIFSKLYKGIHKSIVRAFVSSIDVEKLRKEMEEAEKKDEVQEEDEAAPAMTMDDAEEEKEEEKKEQKYFVSKWNEHIPMQLVAACLVSAARNEPSIEGGTAVKQEELSSLDEKMQEALKPALETPDAPCDIEKFKYLCRQVASASGAKAVDPKYVHAISRYAGLVGETKEGGSVQLDEELKKILTMGEWTTSPPEGKADSKHSNEKKPVTDGSTSTAAGNAVCITLYCLDSQYETLGGVFLGEIFKRFPEHDYCILTMPHSVSEVELLHSFTYIQPLPSTTFSHSLFLIHRVAVLGAMGISVEWAKRGDLIPLRGMLEGVDNAADIIVDARDCVACQEKQAADTLPARGAFTVSFDNQFAGVIIVEGEDTKREAAWLCSEYAVQDAVSMEGNPSEDHATIIHCALDPLFESQRKTILAEVMRQFSKNVLYYRVFPSDTSSSSSSQLLVDEMLQVAPRKIPAPPKGKAKCVPRPALSDKDAGGMLSKRGNLDFALFLTTARLLHEPRIAVNTRIVVVGATQTALAFLESLISNPGANFRSLTMISPNEKNGDSEKFFPIDSEYPEQKLNRLAFGARVKILKSSIKSLDREKKFVVLDDNCTLVPYDHLVLSAALEDHSEQPLSVVSQFYLNELKRKAEDAKRKAEELAKKEAGEGDDDEEEEEKDEDEEEEEDIKIVEPPASQISGVFSIKNPQNAQECCEMIQGKEAKLDVRQRPGSKNVLVYGSTPNALTMIRGLLDQGVDASRIFWLEEESSSSVVASDIDRLFAWHAGSQKVERMVLMSLRKMGVISLGKGRIYTVRHEERDLSGIHFKPGAGRRGKYPHFIKQLTEGQDSVQGLSLFPCGVLACCARPNVSETMYRVIADNSLVYDGRLVVDKDFKTHDPFILSAGTMAKFSRKEGKMLPMECYNPVEVGFRVAERLIDSIVTEQEEEDDDAHKTKGARLRGFNAPVATVATYPGGLNFFHSHIPSYSSSKKNKDTHIIEREGRSQCYNMVFNNGILQSITYIGQESVSSHKLQGILGLPFTYLNGIFEIAKDKKTDVMEFLQKTWSMALFHDRFQSARQKINAFVFDWIQDIAANGSKNPKDLELLQQLYEGNAKDPKSLSKLVALLPEEKKQYIARECVNFCKKNLNHLPYDM